MNNKKNENLAMLFFFIHITLVTVCLILTDILSRYQQIQIITQEIFIVFSPYISSDIT